MSDRFVSFRNPSGQGLKPGWFIGVGIFFVLLGMLAWTDVVTTTLASVVVLGVLLIMAGMAQVLQSFMHRGLSVSGQWLSGIMGIFYIIAGLLMIEEPATGSVFLTAVLAGCLIFAGLSRTFWAAGHRGLSTWWTAAASGLVTLLVGILLYATLPWSGLSLFGTLIAVELIFAGIAAILFGMSLRKNAL
ncbi:DUF308 domain-containing protein [Gluconobacter wancherniae]|uniref:HdeD family acid-resistance protein n=1 Tax=Gluconobacter wancherniae TaxID=1307955 RepID=UPI001B8B5F3A|nr:DUF308 domain-containing protein [Gluconobacter wancherniae]MBS1062715.1 DUF308 domain-containing protein [Gluconobacter wancherniae]